MSLRSTLLPAACAGLLFALSALPGAPLAAQALPAQESPPAGAPAPERIDPEEIRRLVGEVLGDGGYQTELPEKEPLPVPDLPVFSAFGPWLGQLLLVLLGVGLAAFLLYVIVQIWRGRSLPRAAGGGEGVTGTEPGVERRSPSARSPVPAWAEVEAMVGRGAFGEAARALLVRAVLRLATAGPGRSFPASWTSREILGSAAIQGERRSALELLVGTVERWLFGGRTVTDEEARRCVEAARALGDGPGVPP